MAGRRFGPFCDLAFVLGTGSSRFDGSRMVAYGEKIIKKCHAIRIERFVQNQCS